MHNLPIYTGKYAISYIIILLSMIITVYIYSVVVNILGDDVGSSGGHVLIPILSDNMFRLILEPDHNLHHNL